MELTKQELQKILQEALDNGDIEAFESYDARKAYKKSGDLSILETIEQRKVSRLKEKKIRTIKWYKLSEAEALRILVHQNTVIINDQKTIKGWVTFLGVLALLGLIGYFILATQIL